MIDTIMGIISLICAWIILILTLLSIRDFGMHWSAMVLATILLILISYLFVKFGRK